MLALLIAAALLAEPGGTGGRWGLTQVDLPTSGGLITGAFVGSCGDGGLILDVNGVQGCVKTTDAAPVPIIIHPEDNFERGTQTAAPFNIRAGIDEWAVTMTRANCSGDTVTVTVTNAAGTETPTVLTEDGVGGTSTTWNRGATDTTAATNLSAKILAISGVGSSSSAGVLGVSPDLTTAALLVETSDATCAAIAARTVAEVECYSPLDMHALAITNIGAAGTDFSATGGLTTAVGITATTGNINASAGSITANTGLTATTGAITASAGAIIASAGQIYSALPATMAPTGATQTVDWSLGNVQVLDLEDAGSATVAVTHSNGVAGGQYELHVIQDTTGTDTVTWTNTTWSNGTTPTITATANKVDICSFSFVGSVYYGNCVLNF